MLKSEASQTFPCALKYYFLSVGMKILPLSLKFNNLMKLCLDANNFVCYPPYILYGFNLYFQFLFGRHFFFIICLNTFSLSLNCRDTD